MEPEIAEASYGKGPVPVLWWVASPDGLRARELVLHVRVSGRIEASFRGGDNADVLPSDSLRRHALRECARNPGAEEADLLQAICSSVLQAAPALTRVTVTAAIRRWRRLQEHSFVADPPETTLEVTASRTGELTVSGAVRGLRLLTTQGSAFTGFFRDELTTQAESQDRPLTGELDAGWSVTTGQTPPSADTVVSALLGTFADRASGSVQQLLTEMGADTLDALPALASLTLSFRSASLGAFPPSLGTPCEGAVFYEPGSSANGLTAVTVRRPARARV